MATSSSKWTTKDPLDQLTSTQLPQWNEISSLLGLAIPQPSSYVSKSIDDFSPNFGPDGEGSLHIVPFSELNNIIRNGDLVVFMEPNLEITFTNKERVLKQRGWHAEISFRNPDGVAVQCAPYGNGESEIRECQCTELSNHSEFQVASRNNLHIFRIAESSADDGQIKGLLEGVRLWRHVYHHYNFPPIDRAWFLDPADFGSVDELEDIAKRLILSKEVPKMYCMQWVHTVLSLALNFPINRTTLTRLGVLETYQQRWPNLGFVSDTIRSLGRLPIVPYSPQDHVIALCRLYLGMSDAEVQGTLPTLLKLDAIQSILRKVPSRSVPPIVPFSEYRKPAHTGTVTWEYVATSFPNDRCKLK